MGTISTSPSGRFPSGVYRKSRSTVPAESAFTASALVGNSTYSGDSVACWK